MQAKMVVQKLMATAIAMRTTMGMLVMTATMTITVAAWRQKQNIISKVN